MSDGSRNRMGADWEVLHRDHPAEAITEAAGDQSMVVMASRGRSGLARVAFGSVASAVVRHARQPVVALSPPD